MIHIDIKIGFIMAKTLAVVAQFNKIFSISCTDMSEQSYLSDDHGSPDSYDSNDGRCSEVWLSFLPFAMQCIPCNARGATSTDS